METAGFYKARLTERSQKTEVRTFAVNVDPGEGDLLALTRADLDKRLAPLKYDFEYATSYNTQIDENQGRNLGEFFLLLLLVVLFVEQWFAWWCSYHVRAPCTQGRRTAQPWNPRRA